MGRKGGREKGDKRKRQIERDREDRERQTDRDRVGRQLTDSVLPGLED